MLLINLSGELWILNTDGKIPLAGGQPIPKYDSGTTPEQSEITIYVA